MYFVSTPAEVRLTYRPALDGLRALAVLTVMAFHFQSKPLVPGGGIGVDIFFVLSGFLITTLLLQEWRSKGAISLVGFYQRRALRLLPAVGFFLVTYSLIAITLPDIVPAPPIHRLVLHIAAIVTYSYNWLIAFEAPRSPGLTHLWSLSVEEQFYLIWPAMLLVMLRLPSGARICITLSLMVASAALPHVVDAPSLRIYYGTDFRIQSLLWGALLGQLFVAGYLMQVARWVGFQLLVAVSAFFLVAFVVFSTQSYSSYGTPVTIAAGFVVIGAVMQDGALLSNRAFVYIGRRSYALYLWHHAFGAWTSELDAIPSTLLSFALSFVAAEVSYRLVERPALELKARLGRRPGAVAVPATA